MIGYDRDMTSEGAVKRLAQTSHCYCLFSISSRSTGTISTGHPGVSRGNLIVWRLRLERRLEEKGPPLNSWVAVVA